MKTWELTPQEITAYDAALMDHHRCRRSRITIGPMGGPNRFPVQISGQEDFFLVEEVATGERWIWFCCNTCGAIRPLTHPTAPASWREFNVKQEYSIPESNTITTSDNRIILKYLEKEELMQYQYRPKSEHYSLKDNTFPSTWMVWSPQTCANPKSFSSEEKARNEAETLARLAPGEVFLVMQAVCRCWANKAPVSWEVPA